MADRGAPAHPRRDDHHASSGAAPPRLPPFPTFPRRPRSVTDGGPSGAARITPSTRSVPCWRARWTSWPARAMPVSSWRRSWPWWPAWSAHGGRPSWSTNRSGHVTVAIGPAETAGRRPRAGSLARCPRAPGPRRAGPRISPPPISAIRPGRGRKSQAQRRHDGVAATYFLVPVSGSGGVHLGVELPAGARSRRRSPPGCRHRRSVTCWSPFAWRRRGRPTSANARTSGPATPSEPASSRWWPMSSGRR